MTILAGAVTGAVAAVVMILQHRTSVAVAGTELPIGLVLGGLLNLLLCIWVRIAARSGTAVIVHLIVWGLVFMVFAQPGAGGGVLVPLEVGGVPQVEAIALQVLGVGVPLLVLLGARLLRRRSAHRDRRDRLDHREA